METQDAITRIMVVLTAWLSNLEQLKATGLIHVGVVMSDFLICFPRDLMTFHKEDGTYPIGAVLVFQDGTSTLTVTPDWDSRRNEIEFFVNRWKSGVSTTLSVQFGLTLEDELDIESWSAGAA